MGRVGRVRQGPPPTRKGKPLGHGGTVEARILVIEKMMRDLTFVTGKTVKVLAEKWGLAYDTVSEHAAEASQRVRKSVVEDKGRIAATIGLSVERALAGAMKEKDWRTAGHIADIWAKISGTSAATKIAHTGANGGPVLTVDIGSLSEEQLKRVSAGDFSALTGAGGTGASPESSGGDGSKDP